MKKLLALSLLLSSAAQAQYFSPPPNTFSDFTACAPGCAAQLMADFNQIISDGNTSYAMLAAAISILPASTVIPAGAVMMYRPGAICPAGYAAMDGIGGTTDLSGRFVRTWSNGGAIDPGRVRASLQTATFLNHIHAFAFTLPYSQSASFLNALTSGFTTKALVNSLSGGPIVTGASTGAGIGSDTFPAYSTLTYCVKS